MTAQLHIKEAFKGFGSPVDLCPSTPDEWYSVKGSFGAGYYLGDHQCAHFWADDGTGTIFGASLNPSSPLVIQLDGDDIDTYDVDTFSLPLIAHLFGLSKAQAKDFFDEHAQELLLGEEIRTKAIEMGYDLLVLEYEPGVFEVVALVPDVIGTPRVVNK